MTATNCNAADAVIVADCIGDLLAQLDRIAAAEANAPSDPALAAALDVAWRHVVTACAVLADC
jgi:hypothetical protein